MFQPQISSANSAAHFTGMLATLDEYRRQKSTANEAQKPAWKSSRWAGFLNMVIRRFKQSETAEAEAKIA